MKRLTLRSDSQIERYVYTPGGRGTTASYQTTGPRSHCTRAARLRTSVDNRILDRLRTNSVCKWGFHSLCAGGSRQQSHPIPKTQASQTKRGCLHKIGTQCLSTLVLGRIAFKTTAPKPCTSLCWNRMIEWTTHGNSRTYTSPELGERKACQMMAQAAL
eukprot:3891377-Amphidinium_carterae.1